jgi:uncharacterized protein (UPF0332 family)
MDAIAANRTLEHAFRLWFKPELDRRAADGRIPKGFAVWAVQVVLNLDAEPEVRINQEVKGAFVGRPTVRPKVGEAILLSDIAQIESLLLTDDDPNAGHFTALIHAGRWHLFFDFRYNAGRIAKQLEAADEFIAAAAGAVERGHSVAAVDNLYDAAQLMARCFLLCLPGVKALEAKTHGFIETRFNRQAKLGNVQGASAKLLNRVAQLRPKTRYALEPMNVAKSELQQMLEAARAMRGEIEAHRPKRVRPPASHAV